ncbi:MAG: DNA polymerase III subunit chi [Oleiphilaceae bacterium]|nr:DNA polymerase III subunit chi [Oleiphilaceae bacterium]
MNQADIYLLHSTAFSDQLVFCCKLAEKAFRQGLKMHIQTREAYQNEALNERLWDFRAESFLPHTVGQSAFESHPITIDVNCSSSGDSGHRDLLILLTPTLPPKSENFKRVGMIVCNDPQDIQLARQAYKQLSNQGITANIHDFRKK